MKRFAFTLLFGLAVALPVLGQDLKDVPPTPTVNPVTTRKQIDNLNDHLTQLDGLKKELARFGDPTKRQDNETDAEHLQRIERTLKGRALYVHLLHQEVQDALKAKFALESYLDDYRKWADDLADRLKDKAKGYKGRLAKLEQDGKDLSADMIVVAIMLHEEASRSEKMEILDRVKDFIDLGPQVTDLNTRKQKFAHLTVEEKAAHFDTFRAKLEDNRFESELLSTSVIRETEEFAQFLPQRHADNLKMLEETLSKNKDDLKNLETTAARISIVSRYVLDGLALVPPDNVRGNTEEQLRILKVKVPQLTKALDDYLAINAPKPGLVVGGSGGLKSYMRDRLQPSKPATTPQK